MLIDYKKLEELSGEWRLPPAAFRTHLNYISCLNQLSKNLQIVCKINIKNKIQESKYLIKKIHLINLLKENFYEEYKLVLNNPSFAEVCIPWIAVKSYYLIFNLLLILEYLITGDENSFLSTHYNILKDLKSYIKNKDIIFNKPELNKFYRGRNVLNWVAKPHANIRFINPNMQERFFQIIKILMKYCIEDFKRKERINTLNCKKAKKFLNEYTVNVCEFFYWYRIKSNYRDLEFLDKNINDSQFLDFYKNYFELTQNYYKAFTKLINELSIERIGRKIL